MHRPEDAQTMQNYKVIRISRITALSKKDAVKHCQEDINGEYVSTEFAVLEEPKGLIGQLLKQILG